MTDKWPLWWRVLHWMIVWAPVERVDEIEELYAAEKREK